MNTELPTNVLADRIKSWSEINEIQGDFKVKLRPQNPGSTVLELAVLKDGEKISNVVFSSLMDRNKHQILSIRDQNTFEVKYRKKRLMTLLHIFLLNRFKSNSVHYLTPTEDNTKQCEGMAKRVIYKDVNEEVGQLIVAEVDNKAVAKYVEDSMSIEQLLEIKVDKEVSVA